MKASAIRYLAYGRNAPLPEHMPSPVCGMSRRWRRHPSAERVKMRLRDLRRLAAVGRPRIDLMDGIGALTVADLDRLISRYGPDYLYSDLYREVNGYPPAREVAERTDHQIDDDLVEVEDGSSNDAPSHGGDGNSGECQHTAETAAQNRTASETACHAGGAEDTPDGQPTGAGQDGLDPEATRTPTEGSARSNASRGTPAGQGEDGGDEPTGEMGAHRADARAISDESRPDHPAPAQADGSGTDAVCDAGYEASEHGEHGLATHDAGDRVADGEAGTPDARTKDYGGDHLDAAAAGAALAAARHRRDAQRLVAALKRIIGKTCAQSGAQSPRYDAGNLVRELVSKRYAIDRARRHEADIRELIIAVDVSGSCSNTVNAVYAAAMAAARLLPRDRVSVITHSNGYHIMQAGRAFGWLESLIGEHAHKLMRGYYAASQQDASRAVWEAIAKRRPGMVLFLGDMDSSFAHDILHAAGVPVMLMTWITARHMAHLIADYQVINGVIDVKTAADGLEAALKGGVL